MSWLDKYQPKIPEDLLLSKENYNKIYSWLENFKNQTGPNCLYLYGPPGCGKTIIAHTFLNYFGYDITEKNLSNIKKNNDFNNEISDILKKKNILNMFNKKKTEMSIIIDEIEGLSPKEIYILNNILSIIFSKEKHRYLKFTPFIIISDSLTKKIKPFKSKCVIIELGYPDFNVLETYCKKILKNERIRFNKKLVTNIIETSRYDIRQIIINLEYNFKNCAQAQESYKGNYKNIELDDYKYIESHLGNYIGFKDNTYNINKNIAYMLFYENFIEYIIKKKNVNKKTVITRIYKHFSDSDIIDYLLYKYMRWDLINYNNVYKIILNSFLINTKTGPTTSKVPIEMKYSLLLNKNSLEYINLKFINKYSNLIFKNSRSFNIYNIVYILHLLENYKTPYSIESNEFKKLIKFIK